MNTTKGCTGKGGGCAHAREVDVIVLVRDETVAVDKRRSGGGHEEVGHVPVTKHKSQATGSDPRGTHREVDNIEWREGREGWAYNTIHKRQTQTRSRH